jgi:hypothetical protein
MTQAYGFAVPYEDFLPYVNQYVPDAGEFVVLDAIKQAAIEFCERTFVWQYNVPAIDVVAGTNTYLIATPPETKSVGVIAAYYDQSLLIPKSPDELADIYRMGDWQQVSGGPQYITRIIKPELILVPNPSVSNPGFLHIKTAIAPTRDSTGLSSEIFEQYVEAIAWGARSRLLAQPRQDYSDKAGSIEAIKFFDYEINRCRMQTDKGLTRASPRTEFQRWV